MFNFINITICFTLGFINSDLYETFSYHIQFLIKSYVYTFKLGKKILIDFWSEAQRYSYLVDEFSKYNLDLNDSIKSISIGIILMVSSLVLLGLIMKSAVNLIKAILPQKTIKTNPKNSPLKEPKVFSSSFATPDKEHTNTFKVPLKKPKSKNNSLVRKRTPKFQLATKDLVNPLSLIDPEDFINRDQIKFEGATSIKEALPHIKWMLKPNFSFIESTQEEIDRFLKNNPCKSKRRLLLANLSANNLSSLASFLNKKVKLKEIIHINYAKNTDLIPYLGDIEQTQTALVAFLDDLKNSYDEVIILSSNDKQEHLKHHISQFIDFQ